MLLLSIFLILSVCVIWILYSCLYTDYSVRNQYIKTLVALTAKAKGKPSKKEQEEGQLAWDKAFKTLDIQSFPASLEGLVSMLEKNRNKIKEIIAVTKDEAMHLAYDLKRAGLSFYDYSRFDKYIDPSICLARCQIENLCSLLNRCVGDDSWLEADFNYTRVKISISDKYGKALSFFYKTKHDDTLLPIDKTFGMEQVLFAENSHHGFYTLYISESCVDEFTNRLIYELEREDEGTGANFRLLLSRDSVDTVMLSD